MLLQQRQTEAKEKISGIEHGRWKVKSIGPANEKIMSGRTRRGWVREGVNPPSAQQGGMGERCKLPQTPRSFASCALLMPS